MVTHLSTGSWLLNFTEPTIHSRGLNFWFMLVLCTIVLFNLRIPLSLCQKQLKFTAHSSLKWITFVQYQHEPKVKAVSVNGKINKVKQP